MIAQETGGEKDPDNAVHPVTKATGAMQITPVFVQDVNRISGSKYTLADMRDRRKADAALQIWTSHYYPKAEQDKGAPLTDRDKLMMHHGGPDGWKRPDSGYWVERDGGKVWMSNARYADEALSRKSGIIDMQAPGMRYGLSAEPRPADMPVDGVKFDWNNPVASAFAMVEQFGKTWESAARMNPTIAGVDAMQKGAFDSERDKDYDVFSDIEGYEGYAKRFIGVESRHDVQIIKDRIDQELADRDQLAKSGALGVAASLATGILDPINLIPIGGTATVAGRTGMNILKGAGRVALVGAGAASVSEFVLQGVQETRTTEESLYNIAGATLLSGLLGGAASMLGGKRMAELAAAIEKEMDVAAPEMPVQAAEATIANATEIVEAAPEARIDMGVDAPEIVRIEPPTMEEMSGGYVNYGGIQGKLVRDESGAYYIEEIGGGRVMVESGESGVPTQELGVFPFVGPQRKIKTDMPDIKPQIVEMNTYQEGLATLTYSPDSGEFTYFGKPYKYERVNVNKKGDVVSLTATNRNGKEITIRNKEVIHTIELQKEAWEYRNAGEPLASIDKQTIEEVFNELPARDKSRSRAYAEERTSGRGKKTVADGSGKGQGDGGGRMGETSAAEQPVNTGSAGTAGSTKPTITTEMTEEALLNGEYTAWRLCK